MRLKINFKKSITNKLFMITTGIFIMFVLGTLIIQTLFFQEFYIHKKKKDAGNILKNFEQNYAKTNSKQDIENMMSNFELGNNTIAVLDSKGFLRFTGSLSNGKKNENFRSKIVYEVIQQIHIKNLLPYIKENKDINKNMLKGANFIKGNFITASYIDEKNEYAILITSLQPVNEAIEVIKQFYIYFFVGALILLVLLSLIYSNMITKPLIRINKVALKMSKLDFSEKCVVTSKDEIGNLGSTLNFLSENLQDSLKSLKKANLKLESDIDKERKLKKMSKEFIAAVSHELKTPINIIAGYAEVLKDDIVSREEKQSYLDIIIDESKKMGTLVSDMMYLSRLESGNFSLIKEEFYIDDLIRTTIRKFTAIINDKNIELNINLIDKIRVYADWNRIEQVITNYLTNAIRHTGTNNDISISMIDCGEEVKVEVANTGVQIPEEELENIWNKFHKVDKSRHRQVGGTGMGLAIVKNIIELHKGKYGVENISNGVKFYFALRKN